MNLRDYNAVAERLEARPQYRGTVITVHGMKTYGPWQKEVSLALQDSALRHEPVDYGYVLFKAVCRWMQDSVSEKIIAAFREQEAVVPGGPHGVIAHSFGTLCLGRSLQQNPSLRLSGICLFGSVLPRNFPWKRIWERKQFRSVMNETCEGDPWPRWASWLLRWAGAGASGCDGFMETGAPVHECPYDWTGHTCLGSRLHCEHTWIPFLLEGVVPSTYRK